MNLRMKLWLAALLLMSFGVVSEAQETQQYKQAQQAQQPAKRSLTREQQAALDQQDQALGQAALVLIKMIDENKASELWDTSSAITHKIVSRSDFVAKVASDRAALGTPGTRMPLGVRHLQTDGSGGAPADLYVNVAFDTRFSKTPRNMQEIITFVLEADNTWRFAGYSIH
ncbi:Membrane-fusion protein [Candidatus Burkholderia humilis]|nr:Membrane-fusion protein [Candidatus Burkholderia humilis]